MKYGDSGGMYDALQAWAKRTTTSFADFITSGFDREAEDTASGTELIYRLKRWPELSADYRTADVLRTLSVMSSQPVNRRWILSTSCLKPRDVDKLLALLQAQDVLDIVDPAKFRPTAG